MEFKTSISKIEDEDIIIRGIKLSKLIEKNSFTDTIFILLRNREPTKTESEIFSALLISIIDHGMGTTSSLATRFVMSSGNSLNTAVGAGVLALGDYHGGAIENAMNQLIKLNKEKIDIESYIKESIKNNGVIFGYGHKVYKEKDPRVIKIISLCNKLNFNSVYVNLAIEIEKKLEKIKGKKICLNIDGLIAAILLEMGFKADSGKGIFIIGRIAGLVAQALEEKEKEGHVRRVEEEDIKYTKE